MAEFVYIYEEGRRPQRRSALEDAQAIKERLELPEEIRNSVSGKLEVVVGPTGGLCFY